MIISDPEGDLTMISWGFAEGLPVPTYSALPPSLKKIVI